MKDLPDPVRPYWVMVHQTESNQKANMEEPRVIINDPTGRFILATETGPGANTLETAVFDYKTNKWKFLGLTYLADGRIEKDSESCKSCHSESPRPIWKGYRDWGKIFGNNDDLLPSEIDMIKQFSKDSSHPVFSNLKYLDSYPANQTIRPATPYSENSNNQIMNFFIAKNAGFSLTHDLIKEQKHSEGDLLKLVFEMLCTRDISAIHSITNALGLKQEDYFEYHKLGTGNPERMWIGFVHQDFVAGVILMRRLFEANSNLKTRFPELFDTLTDDLVDTFYLNDVNEFNGWYSSDFSWLSQFYLKTMQNSLSCHRF
jgi:hypothetical protein